MRRHPKPPAVISTMERLIERPIPSPLGFVVWNAVKICSRVAGSSPIPESRTVTTTFSSPLFCKGVSVPALS